tara:strand:+ start:328 stop:1506 length:1179 start_codon:yes stop_codon:yes gene_type:complete
MKLNHKLLSCPSNLKFNKINSYYNRLLPIFEKVLFTLNLTSTEKVSVLTSRSAHVTINEDNQKWQMNKIMNELIKNKIDIYKPFTSCRFISTNMMYSILTKHTSIYDVFSTYNTNKVTIRVFDNEDIYCSFKNRLDLANKMTKIFSLLEFFNIENNHVKIYFAPVDIPKIFPNSEVFSPDCINSGGTIHEGNKAHIILFRKEESDKVLVHELIHYLKLDFAMSNVYWGNINGINNRVVSEFNVTPSHQYINLFEALTDTLAIVFNSMCNCIITKSDINDYFYTELIYSRTIAGNILKHSGFRNVSDLMDTNKTNKLKQSTSVLAYYILKCSLLNNTDIVLSKYCPKFSKYWSLRDINEFYQLTKKDLNTINNLPFKLNSFNSLRMTYNDILY